MHRFQSKSTITRFRWASFLLCMECLLVPCVLVILVDALVKHDADQTVLAIGLGGGAVLLGIVRWMLAARTRCPLCMTPVLAKKSCAKHRNARKLFGSHRLRVAVSVLFRGSFNCPYCHEPSAMEVRQRATYVQARRS